MSYQIEIRPFLYVDDPSNLTFVGRTKIFVRCAKKTSEINLHSKSLQISANEVLIFSEKSKNFTAIRIKAIRFYRRSESLKLLLNSELKEGENYFIEFVKFTGEIRRNGKGFYLSHYRPKRSEKFKLEDFFFHLSRY